MANLLKRKIAPVPFAGSVTDARTILGSLRTRGTPPAIWLINTYWAEEMLPELDTMIGNSPVIFFKRDLFGAGLSSQMPAIAAPDKISTLLGKMTPRLTVLWAFGTGNSETISGRVADAIALYLADGNFRHIEEASPGHNSVTRAMTSANENLQAFRAQMDVAPVKGSSTSSAPAVRDGEAPPRPRSKPAAPVRRGITGNIEQLGLSTLLMMMEMEKKTGELVLNSETAQATLFIKGGRIIGAAARGASVPAAAFSGPECVFNLFTWKSGMFEFLIKDVTCEDTVQASTTSLLMEGARRMDESSGSNDGGGDSILG